MKSLRFFSFSFIVVILDQISKIIIRNTLDPNEIIKVTHKLFWLTYVQNDGSAFSFNIIPNNPIVNRYVLIVITTLASILIGGIVVKSHQKIEKIVFALILGGALGNLIDRILLGSVTDFLWLDFPDIFMERWPIFNIADSAIVIAIAIMIVYALFFAEKKVEDK